MQKQTRAVSKSQVGAGDFPYEISNFCSFSQSSIFFFFFRQKRMAKICVEPGIFNWGLRVGRLSILAARTLCYLALGPLTLPRRTSTHSRHCFAVSRSSGVQKWLQQLRSSWHMKDIMASEKRLQVARLVCEPSLVILWLVTYRILDKDLVLEVFSDTDWKVVYMWQGFR